MYSLKPQIPQFFCEFLMKLTNTKSFFYRYVLLNCVHRSNVNGKILVQGGFQRRVAANFPSCSRMSTTLIGSLLISPTMATHQSLNQYILGGLGDHLIILMQAFSSGHIQTAAYHRSVIFLELAGGLFTVLY